MKSTPPIPSGATPPAPAETTAVRRQVGRVVHRAERKLSSSAAHQRHDVERAGRLRRKGNAVLQGPVVDPLLGTTTVASSDVRVSDLQTRIEREHAAGDIWHERVHQLLRLVLIVVLLADGAVLLQFLSGVFNVDWEDPYGVPLLLAGVFAAGVTLITFGALTLAGVRLRQRRDPEGTVPWRELDATTYVMLGTALAAALGVAVLMYERISYEVQGSLGGQSALPVVFGLAFALLSVVANLTVVHVHADDGSPQAHRAAGLSRTVARRLRRHRRLQRRADRVAERAVMRARAAQEVRDLCISETARRAARIWPDAEGQASALAPDLRAVTALVEQIDRLARSVASSDSSGDDEQAEGSDHDGPDGPGRTLQIA